MSLNTGHVLTTARMTLADITEGDFVATYAADRDPMVARYVGDGLPESRSFEEYCDYFKGRVSSWMNERYRMWAMRLHGDDALLGWVMLRPVNDTPHVEVGYRLPQSSWGKGYATEATRAVLAFGFNTVGLDEITAPRGFGRIAEAAPIAFQPIHQPRAVTGLIAPKGGLGLGDPGQRALRCN